MATSEQIFTDQQRGEPRKATLSERYVEMWKSNFAKRQSFSSALAAIGREAIKDIRSTFMESYFGKPEHPGEPGTPFNPTQMIVTQEMGNFHGYGDTGLKYEEQLEHSSRSGPEPDDDRSR